MYDLSMFLIYQLPVLAFGLLIVLTFVIPALHSLIAVGRVLTGHPAHINWWVIGRVLPLVIGLAIAGPLYFTVNQWTSEWQLTVAEIVLVYFCVAVVFLPVALPLLQAYVTRAPRMGTLVYAMLAILSLPVAASLATQTSAYATQAVVAAHDPSSVQDGFTAGPLGSRCANSLASRFPEGFVSFPPPADTPFRLSYPAYFFFWADMSLKAVFLDFFEVFDCSVTNMRHNPDHILLSSFVFLYRAFVSIIVLAVIALPFRRRVL